jgi:hypothetical protein
MVRVNVRIMALLFLLLIPVGVAQAQVNTSGADSAAGPVRMTIATGVVAGFFAGSLVMSYNDWWKGSATAFHFVREGFLHDYSLGIDKFGHAYTTYLYFHTIHDLLKWGGYSPSAAYWWGAAGSGLFGVLVEIGDGYSPYGFSWEDLAADFAGLGFGMLQSCVPLLQSLQFKWSYVPRDGFRWPPHFTDHYDWHTYWLALDMHRLLPENIGALWPEFIQLAVGYGVDRGQTRRELVIGLDFNLKAFASDNREVQLLENISTRFHFPAPAVKFTESEGSTWYLIHKN